MPTTTWGPLLPLASGAALAAGLSANRILGAYADGWAFGGAVVAALVAFYVSVELPYLLEFFWVRGMECPECGSRNWSYPWTSGFG